MMQWAITKDEMMQTQIREVMRMRWKGICGNVCGCKRIEAEGI